MLKAIRLSLLIAAVFLTPAVVTATPLSAIAFDSGDAELELSDSFFHASILSAMVSCAIDDCANLPDDAVFNAHIRAGALLSHVRVVEGFWDYSTYEYGPGLLDIEVRSLTGGIVGYFSAPVPWITIEVSNNGGDGGIGSTQQDLAIGPGRFDPAAARFLRLAQLSLGGRLGLTYDIVEGGPESSYRRGVANFPHGIIDVAVPEPHLALLFLATGAALGRISRARRRVQVTTRSLPRS